MRPAVSLILRRFGITASVLSALLAGSAFVHKVTLEIPFMKPGSTLPKRYTKKDKNISPPLVWSSLPNDVRELALILEDIDEPRVHWVVYAIPATLTGLREGLPSDEVIHAPAKLSGIIQGITDFKGEGAGYHGPDPQSDKQHQYRFTIYALNARLALPPGLDKTSLLTLIQSHIIGQGELVVTFPEVKGVTAPAGRRRKYRSRESNAVANLQG